MFGLYLYVMNVLYICFGYKFNIILMYYDYILNILFLICICVYFVGLFLNKLIIMLMGIYY